MSPEFGATATIFPIDDETLAYLRLTGRTAERIALVERYAQAQGLWREPGAGPDFDELLELDLASVEPSVAGPRRPQDRVPLARPPRQLPDGFPDGRGARRRPAPRTGGRTAARSRTSSADSFPASDPPAFVPRRRPMPTSSPIHRRPDREPGPPTTRRTIRPSRSTVDGRGRRSSRARSRSPRSPRARTPRTRP